MLIAQLSDPHVTAPGSAMDRLCRTTDALELAVAHVNALSPRPDVTLLTGDLVDKGGIAEYQRFRDAVASLAMPAYVIPGNHDDRANLTRVLDGHRYLPRDGSFLQYAIEDWPVRLLALDTLVPGSDRGALCETRLAWLDARLAEAPERPTLVLMHHPPFPTGISAMDAMGLDDAHHFATVIGRHPQVERVVCGHVHRPIVRRFAGTVACVCPSSSHQVALDLPPAKRLGVVMEPPAAMLHVWLGESEGLVTHLSPIDEQPVYTVFDGDKWLPNAKPPAGFARR
jgi:Icc protein